MKPERLVLSRHKGFNLDALSHERNGLPVQTVARPGKWGNPFTIDAVKAETGLDRGAAQAEAVARYGRWVAGTLEPEHWPGRAPPSRAEIRRELKGRNLACWCRAGTPCHGDILIALAND